MFQKYISYSLAGFIMGIFLMSVIPGLAMNIFSLLWLLGLILLCVMVRKQRHSLSWAFFLCSLVLGAVHMSYAIESPESQIFDQAVEHSETIHLNGRIVSDPDRGLSGTRFVFQTKETQTRISVRTDTYTEYAYGDYLELSGRLKKPESFETDRGRTFDYEAFLANDGIFYTMSFPEVHVHRTSEINNTVSLLFRLKRRLIESIDRFVPRPESGLLAGILFGEKSALDDDTTEQFRRVGLMHIVVLSGYNVAIVIYALMFLFRFLPLSLRSLFAVLGIVAFTIITGAGPTVVRAAIMALVIVLAKLIGKKYDVKRSLLLALVIMLIWNPRLLYFDLSFQLSFLATYGLLVFAPIFEKKLSWLPRILLIRESAVASISAQIMVLPLLLYRIGEFSLISVIVNILVLFVVPWTMLFGFITSVFGTFSNLLASLFAFPTTILLQYQLCLVELFSDLSFALIIFPPFHPIFLIVMYLGIFYCLRYLQAQTLSESMRI